MSMIQIESKLGQIESKNKSSRNESKWILSYQINSSQIETNWLLSQIESNWVKSILSIKSNLVRFARFSNMYFDEFLATLKDISGMGVWHWKQCFLICGFRVSSSHTLLISLVNTVIFCFSPRGAAIVAVSRYYPHSHSVWKPSKKSHFKKFKLNHI